MKHLAKIYFSQFPKHEASISKFINNFNLSITSSAEEGKLKVLEGWEHGALFKYKKWHIHENIPKDPSQSSFTYLSPEQFYTQCDTSLNTSGPCYKGEKIITWQKERTVQFIQNLFTSKTLVYQELDSLQKHTIWSIIIGFPDMVNLELFKKAKNTHQTSRNIDAYIERETSLKRIIKINKPGDKTFAPSIFVIEENKCEKGVEYVKYRHVYNNVPCNKILEPPALNLQYTFPTAELIFREESLFNILMKSKHLSVIDRTDYFRQWPIHPSSYRLSLIKNKDKNGNINWYQDMTGRMGHTFSSAYSQSISSLMDKIFNRNATGRSVTLQDDTFLLASTQLAFSQAMNLNENFGFQCNTKKCVELATCVKWSGYMWDVDNQCLFLPEKKLEKIKTQISEIGRKNFSTRREYCSLLSRLYSARLIVGGLAQNLSSLVYITRKHARLDHQWFFTDLQLRDSYYDERVPKPNSQIMYELFLSLDILRCKVKFERIRDNFDFIVKQVSSLALIKVEVHEKVMRVFCDASGTRGGFHISWKKSNFMHAEEIPQAYMNESINFKELYMLCKAVLAASFVAKNFNYRDTIVVFVDNELAKVIALKRKVKLRDNQIYKLALFLSHLTLMESFRLNFQRVDTVSNVIADTLSRKTFDSKLSAQFKALDLFLQS